MVIHLHYLSHLDTQDMIKGDYNVCMSNYVIDYIESNLGSYVKAEPKYMVDNYNHQNEASKLSYFFYSLIKDFVRIIAFKNKYISETIKKSKRPAIIIGGGIRISKTNKELLVFLKGMNVPLITTWSGVDAITHDHKNYIGNVGVYGSRAANFVIQNSDFVLSQNTLFGCSIFISSLQENIKKINKTKMYLIV